jgi:hypothetical protein
MNDWALITIDDGLRPFVSPQIVHWTGPVGVANHSSSAPGSLICMVGHGVAFRDALPHRCGTLQDYAPSEPQQYTAYLPIWQGDSGAAVLDYETGHLVGIVSSGINGAFAFGLAFCDLFPLIRAQGLEVVLSTAPFSPPASDPTPGHEVLPVTDGQLQCAYEDPMTLI